MSGAFRECHEASGGRLFSATTGKLRSKTKLFSDREHWRSYRHLAELERSAKGGGEAKSGGQGVGRSFPELQEHQARIEKALDTAKPEAVAQGKALLSANCEQYIEAQGFDAEKLLGIISAKHQATETISYKDLYETCHRIGGKWGKEIGTAAARFCTGAASIWGGQWPPRHERRCGERPDRQTRQWSSRYGLLKELSS